MNRRPEESKGDNKRKTPIDAGAEAMQVERAMGGVVRLAPDPRGRVRTTPRVSTPGAATPSPSKPVCDEDGGVSESGFVAPGVDRRELRKLRRGEYAPSSRLDVHGQTAAEAAVSVKRFIDNGRRHHHCVCIVHGRGLHSKGNVAILKTRVRECLRQHRAVLAYTDAPRSDGGPGAVYLLLRK